MFVLRLLLCVLACVCAGDAYNILVIFPFPGQSHSILGDGVIRHLLNAGHEVTHIAPYSKHKPHPKLRLINVAEGLSKPALNIKAIMDNEVQLFSLDKFFNMTVGTFRETFENKEVQAILNDPKESFDLVIAEWMLLELYAGYATVFNCPFIWVSTVEPHSAVLSLIDETLNPAYNAGLISTNTPPLDFFGRVKELIVYFGVLFMKNVYLAKSERLEFETQFGPILRKRGLPVPEFEDVKYNASLILGNSHVAMGQATRLPQSYKAIGGYHIDTDIKPLPEDLQKLLDNAKHGVIYFSLGSNLRSTDLPDVVKRDLLKVFGSLKQTVIWKFEETLPDLPSNVHILQWAPQPAILSHPKCILFITHGGLLSSTETIHFGKPTIGIPVFADQFANVERAARKGYGKRVDLSYGIAADLKIAIEEVISNPSYSKRAKELSFIYHHRPTPPGKELVHWVEHVIETKGARHLRSPALDMPFYQKMYLDLAAVILAIFIALKFTFKLLASCFCKRKRVDSNKKNK